MTAYEQIFRSIPDAYVLMDVNRQVLLVNPAFTRLFGFESGEIIGRQPQILFASPDVYNKLWELMARNGNSTSSIVPFRRKDGTIFRGEVSEARLDEDGVRVLRILPAGRKTEKVDTDLSESEAVRVRNQAFRAALRRQDSLPILIGQLLEVSGAEAAAILTTDTRRRADLVVTGGQWSAIGLERRDLSPEVLGVVFEQGHNLFATGPDEIAEVSGLAAGSMTSAVAIPLQIGLEIGGVLWVGRTRAFDPDEIQLIVAAADLMADQLHRAARGPDPAMEEIAAFQSLGQAITESLDLHVTLGVFISEIINHLRVDAADILIYQSSSRELRFVAGRGFRSFNKERHTVRFGTGLPGQAVVERRTVRIDHIGAILDTISRNELFEDENFQSYAALPMIARGEIKGVVELFHRERMKISGRMMAFLEAVTTQAAIAVDKAELYEGFHRTQSAMELLLDSTLLGWARALDMRDRFGNQHTQWMIDFTQQVAQDLGIPGDRLPNVRRGVILHDIGKMGVPERILDKPGPLTSEEWDIMRKHPVFAQELLSHIPFLRPALEIPYCHHERWNGSGYPRGLRGTSIPLAARVFAVIDVWDAMTSPRPYRKAASGEKARKFIEEGAGELFDPDVVAAFRSRLLENGSQVRQPDPEPSN